MVSFSQTYLGIFSTKRTYFKSCYTICLSLPLMNMVDFKLNFFHTKLLPNISGTKVKSIKLHESNTISPWWWIRLLVNILYIQRHIFPCPMLSFLHKQYILCFWNRGQTIAPNYNWSQSIAPTQLHLLQLHPSTIAPSYNCTYPQLQPNTFAPITIACT